MTFSYGFRRAAKSDLKTAPRMTSVYDLRVWLCAWPAYGNISKKTRFFSRMAFTHDLCVWPSCMTLPPTPESHLHHQRVGIAARPLRKETALQSQAGKGPTNIPKQPWASFSLLSPQPWRAVRMTSVYAPSMTSAYDLRVWLCVWLAYGSSKQFFWYKLL